MIRKPGSLLEVMCLDVLAKSIRTTTGIEIWRLFQITGSAPVKLKKIAVLSHTTKTGTLSVLIFVDPKP